MKPQDLVILIKIIILKQKKWTTVQLAQELFISQSEISKALSRLSVSGLLNESKKHPARRSIYDFIVSSVMYLFPTKPGRTVKGIPTAHSAYPVKSLVVSDINYVWPSSNGSIRGESIEPLYKNAPLAAMKDKELYALLALIDVLRVGKAREVELARIEIKTRILYDE